MSDGTVNGNGGARRQLHDAAMQLFTAQGYADTTVDAIAAAAGTSRRTFFRHFETKSAVVWFGFDDEVDRIAHELAAMPASMSMATAIRLAVIAVGHERSTQKSFRVRAQLLTTEPEVAAGAAEPLDAWARAVAGYAARRSGLWPDSLVPLTLGRSVLAAARTAVERWVGQPGADLTQLLDTAVRAVIAGFDEASMVPEPRPDLAPLR